METILVLCAHSDDQILGPGGTLARYAKEGQKIKTVIFSFGESSHPHLKEEVIITQRIKEADAADKVIGGMGVKFLGLKDTTFKEDLLEKKAESEVRKIITSLNPSKIFTHSIDDPHPHHSEVYYLLVRVLNQINFKGDVYSFDIWNPLNIRKRKNPKLYVDVTNTFKIKLTALKCFESQQVALFTLLWSVHARAIAHGIHHGCRYAERFYKVDW